MKILCLNIRGFGSGKHSKIGDCRKLLIRESPSIVALQETRLNNIDKNWVSLVWGSQDFEFIQKEKIGNSGGFLIIWDKNEFVMEQSFLGDFFVAIVGTHDAEWVLCVDFNEVRDQSERKNCDFIERRAKWFNEFIDKNRLIDVPLGGKKFTRICDNRVKFSKLDRFLVSESFHNTWGNISTLALERKLSDHCPIVLRDREIDYGPKPTKIFDEWLDGEESKKWWMKLGNLMLMGIGIIVSIFGQIDSEIEELKSKACEWESYAENRVLNDEDRRNWLEIRKQWLEKDGIKANMVRQKSRVKWIHDGDENTKYFHSFFKRRNSRRNIRGLNLNGVWCEDPIEVKQAAHDYFKTLYERRNINKMRFMNQTYVGGSFFQHGVDMAYVTGPLNPPALVIVSACPTATDTRASAAFSDVRSSVSNATSAGVINGSDIQAAASNLDANPPGQASDDVTKISVAQATEIEGKFTEKEVLDAIKECDCSKAPGPDGFKFKFFNLHWELIKEDLMKALDWFWVNCDISNGCNASFITLVPKNNDPLGLNEFRPISLIGCYYKILAKILSIRIRKVLPSVIGYEQSAYLREWVLDVDGESGFMLASNRPLFRFLLTGHLPTSFFIERGVRQGDPLSPFLFLIATEGLNLILKRACREGLFKGVEVGMDKIGLSHLQFADDTIFFGEWRSQNFCNLMKILKCYKNLSGLKINFHKSVLYGVGVASIDIEGLASRVGCKVGDLPFIYLGLSVDKNMSKEQSWKPVIEKFYLKLSNWKARSISYGGRLTLIKSVLSSLPLYYFSLFRAPLSVLKSLEYIRRNFFWGGTGENSKLSWVKWDECLLPYDFGGLNIGSLRGKNLALLGKWFWRAKTEPNALWVTIIKSIYGSNGLLPPTCLSGPVGCGSVWSNIFRAVIMIEKLDTNFASSFIKIIGDVADTDFWNDSWLCGAPLKQRFPRLFHLDEDSNARVQDRITWMDHSFVCNFRWKRDVSGRAINELDSLMALLNDYVKQDKAKDSWIWNLAGNGLFSTKKLAFVLDEKILNFGSHANNEEFLKNNLVPSKVAIFIWRALKRRIPVRTELDKRGIDLDSVRCPLCDDNVESIEHSLIFCRYAMDIWVRVYKWWGLGVVSNLSINELFRGNCNRPLSPLWSSIWQALEWTCGYLIWKNRNQKVFSNSSWCGPSGQEAPLCHHLLHSTRPIAYMTGSSTLPSSSPLHKAYSITNIKSHIPLILTLDHLNYDAWTDLFETHCIGFDVIDHIDNTYDKRPPPTDPEWVKLDSIVRMWIYSTISPDVLENIHEKKSTARATWLNLETLFRTNKDSTALQLEHDLRNFTLGDMSIKDYCTKIKSMADLLKNIGEPVSDKHLVAYTLQGLPRKWNGVTRAIRLREKQPTWVQTRAILLSEESKLDDTRSSNSNSSSPIKHSSCFVRYRKPPFWLRMDRRNDRRQPPTGQYGWVYIPPPPPSQTGWPSQGSYTANYHHVIW
ncbi:uncharacterized protein [Rutidosis leptorrhynchoides]|uniref:uncharacterized protein n=1 Tax=Rutidosis leptorrhynchoides TaxID=125765 RepID=UPI003A98D672